MKKYLFFALFILVIACTNNEKKANKNIMNHKIEFEKELTFEEYVYLLIKTKHFNKYPDINNVPE